MLNENEDKFFPTPEEMERMKKQNELTQIENEKLRLEIEKLQLEEEKERITNIPKRPKDYKIDDSSNILKNKKIIYGLDSLNSSVYS